MNPFRRLPNLLRISARAFALLLPLFPAATLHAQISRGTVSGRVTDPTGAVVPNVPVVATDVATGAKSNAVSNNAGDYTIPFLAPGRYRVNASATGFKSFLRENVVVDANIQVNVDISLEVGQTDQVVTISSETPLLETSSASTGQVLNTEDIQNLPVDGNTPLIVSQLALGVIPTNSPQFFHPYDNSGPSGFAMGDGSSKNFLQPEQVLIRRKTAVGMSVKNAYAAGPSRMSETFSLSRTSRLTLT